jgi:hypothetical protein
MLRCEALFGEAILLRSDASSEWLRASFRYARLAALAAAFAGLAGCAVSMPMPGLIDKTATGSIPAKPAANPDLAASMRAEEPADAIPSSKAGLKAN